MLRIRVNATSANLAVGFDVLGLALSLYNELEFAEASKFKLAGFLDNDNIYDNLAYIGYISVFKYLNKEIIPVEIRLKANIPAKRGLGSSASLIVGGIYGANAILNYPLEDDALFNIAAKLEGHPDNACAAIFGGLSSAYREGDCYRATSYMVSDSLKYAVLIPPYEVETKMAREILPFSLSYEAVVHTMGRLAALPKAFAIGDSRLISELFSDRIQEPYRAKLIKGYAEIKEACLKEGIAMAISGSGSSLLLIANDEAKFDKISYEGYSLIKLELGNGVEIEED